MRQDSIDQSNGGFAGRRAFYHEIEANVASTRRPRRLNCEGKGNVSEVGGNVERECKNSLI